MRDDDASLSPIWNQMQYTRNESESSTGKCVCMCACMCVCAGPLRGWGKRGISSGPAPVVKVLP